MHNYLKMALAVSMSVTPLLSLADYKVNYFLDKNNISFKNKPLAQWLASTPTYSEWAYVGDYFNCQSALPTADSQPDGVSFTQTLSECTKIRSRTVQEREQNNQTHEYRNVGIPVEETENEEHLTYTKQLTGTKVSFSFTFSAGKSSAVGGDTIVGLYARTNAGISLGSTVLNENGARILLYYYSHAYYNAMTVCSIRFAMTAKTGWTPGGVTPPTAMNDLKKYNYIDLYKSSTLVKRYSVAAAPVLTSDAGYFKEISVPCSEMSAFYANTTLFNKVELNKD
jgi:hypothetical protein